MNILLFGATGSAGRSVLQVCLASPVVTQVRAIVRRPIETSHPKLQVTVHSAFLDYSGLAQTLSDISACFFCLGISVYKVSSELEYRHITRDIAMAAASALQAESPTAAFHYISGQGAHLRSRFMWARVKAEAERDLIARVGAVCWRPSAIDGAPSASEPLYARLRPLYRLLKPFRNWYVSGEDLSLAMLEAAGNGVRSRIIENAEIRDLADRVRTTQTGSRER